MTGSEIDLCVNDPGKDVDVYITTTLKTMTDVWMRDTTYKKVMRENKLTAVGDAFFTRNINDWLGNCEIFQLPAASQI